MAADCPWPGGSVARQLPLMARHGVPVDELYAGTLNIALDCTDVPYPSQFEFDFVLDWRSPDKPTHFRLHALKVYFEGAEYLGWSYRKIYPEGFVSRHPQPSNVIEILAPKVSGIQYGDAVSVKFNN